MFFFVPLRKILYPHQAIMCFCNLAFCDMKVNYDYNMEAKFKYGLFPSTKEDTWKVTLELEKISTEEYPDKPLIVKVEYDIQVGKVSYPLLVN